MEGRGRRREGREVEEEREEGGGRGERGGRWKRREGREVEEEKGGEEMEGRQKEEVEGEF